MTHDDAVSSSFEGTWVVPKFGMEAVGGIYEPGASPALRVFGELWPTKSYSPTLIGNELPPVLGYSAGRRITLLSPEYAGHTRHGDSVSETRIFAPTSLIGEHFEEEKEAKFSAAQVSLTGSTIFANPPDFADTVPHGPGPRGESIFYEPLEVERASLNGEAEVSLVDYLERDRRQWIRAWRRAQLFRFEFDTPHSIEEIEFKYIRPLRYLISLAVDRPTRCSAFSVEHPESRYEHVDWPRQIVVRSSSPGFDSWSSENPAEGHQDRIFDLSKVSFSSLVTSWFLVVNKLGAISDLIFCTDAEAGFVENQFFDLASAFEGLSRQLEIPAKQKQLDASQSSYMNEQLKEAPRELRDWIKRRLGSTEEPSFEARVNAVVGFCGPWMREYVGNNGSWANTIAHFRNDVAHPSGGGDVFTEHRLTGRLVTTMRVVLRVSLLRMLNFTHDDCHDILSASWNWRAPFRHGPRDFPHVFN